MARGDVGRLAGLRCLVVGGTGGIGRASVERFLEEGARVVAAGHPDDAGALEALVASRAGAAWEATVRAEEEREVAELFGFAHKALGGGIDVLFHVTGISGRRFGDGPLDTCTLEGWERVLAVNARSVFLTNRAVVQIMRVQEPDAWGVRGSVINLGSVVDRSPSARHFGTIAYAASKGAVRALTLASAARYAVEGVRFNLIEPGLVDTPMAARALGDETLRRYRMTKQRLTEGAVTGGDVAEAAVYLASASARAVTGATITVDGGWSVCEGQDEST
jgi:NAD(P)-dependent dehydrogenase (short-subunit alcohol dehydrogenase family)